MSDLDEDAVFGSGDAAEDVEEQEEERPAKSKRRDYDEVDDDEEEEGDEEDEDEDEEDEGTKRGSKRAKHRHKRPTVNRFIDLEAEVDEEDEEEDEDDEFFASDGFLAEPGVEGEDDDDTARRARDHARYDRRVREMDDRDLQQVAEDISQRYRRTAVRYTGEMSDVPQRLLMPSVHDANLWQVRVRPGKERDIVFSLMRKAIDLEYSARPTSILSAFQRDSLPGMIYVEARSAKQVSEAINGLVGVFPSRGIVLVPIEEMASLLQIKQQELTVTPGSWVRIKRGKYQGDLAQVMDVTENGEEVGLKFIPRIDLNPKDQVTVDGKKRKKSGLGLSSFNMRPPQRFFNYEEVARVYGRKSVVKRNVVFVFQNDTYKDGFIEKDFRLTALQLDDVNPTLDEITRFTRGQDGNDNEANVDLSIIAEASRKAAISVLQPGDHVEVFEGEQSGVHGTVHSIEQDVVTIEPVGVDFDGQRIQLPARSVRKRFKPGDHVKVMTGKNADETGLVVSVVDNVVTFLSDMSMQEVSVFSKDLREAAEVGTGTNIVGNYELHDLVQIDHQTVGVIFKTERDSFRVLDQHGQVRLVQPHQISMRRDSNRAIAVDSQGFELRAGDNVKEVDGESRKGRVLHTHQSYHAFLHNRDYTENGGVFVTRSRSLQSLAPKGSVMKLGNTDLSKMNPALSGGAGGMVGSGTMGRGPRDRLIGVNVMVIKGPNKGYAGVIKDTNGPHARVELVSGNKIITIDKEKLRRRSANGLEELERPMGMATSRVGFGGGQTPNPYSQGVGGGGRTPAWGNTGRTPNPYNNSQTPGWGGGNSRTPNPYAESGKTPAWGDNSSRTPNSFNTGGGGKTPAWNSSSRTPNPYANGGGASAWGGATPGRPTNAGGAASGWDAWDRGAPTPYAAAFTPGAPTPGPYTSLQTPGVYEFQTPAATNAYPMTPAVLGGAGYGSADTQFEVSPTWLLDPDLKDKVNGMFVEVKGSFGADGWHNGDYEGKQGVVLSVLATGNDTFESTARVRFLDPVDRLQPILAVPVHLLSPIHPEKQGEEVVILAGNNKGLEARVEDVESSSSMVLTTKATFLVVESAPERLVLLRHIDEVGNILR
ncbi:transcription elongation factor Spt5 [Epithele typhae]|uniref:transcription elongation factor Spt5 n=1 Tax=Epithele typhae TaxID=378194 RepID=UPI002007305B|nr:transcription elongation factor Spt5 [Epithele typhae]KAH9946425.1 transcription elongation factor Spt5 [Epithele typhae]